MKFNQFLNKDLNENQLKAVTIKSGPLIVIAGAGSGKTRVITSRIANLIINQEASPDSIVALTFTNKAAMEMKQRLVSFLDLEKIKKLPFVGTFHSYCLLLLRSNPTLLDYPKFSILDGDDQKNLIKKIIKKFGLEKQFSVNDINYQISNFKNKLNLDFENFTIPIIKEIYLEYESEKAKAHSFDFDDLLLKVLNIFKTNSNFRENFQQKTKHVLVDEYQDTNMVQHELLKYMSLNQEKEFCLKSICAVGDEDQSIYSWRGAIATNMQNFQKDFSPAILVKIEQNYRSVQPILKAANTVIDNNKNRIQKKLWSNKKAQNRILNISCNSGKQEAYSIANLIDCLSKEKNLNQIAILYRTHYQSRNIEEALISNSIPYKIIGGLRFYERKEIKDILAYLRLITNPYDRISLFRIINCPTRGLGIKFDNILQEEWNKNQLLDFDQLLHFLLKTQEINLTASKKTAILDFLQIYKDLKNLNKASEQVELLIDKINYFNYLQKKYEPREADIKIENVKEFIQSIYNFEKENEKNDLEEFLHQITLMQEYTENKENNQDQIQCMTLHAAKGLEFNTVIITGLEEGLLPSNRSLNTNKELEEERRLFYVGMTRAREKLILTHANYRNSYGQISDQVISRFLTEIPGKLIKSIDITNKNQTQTTLLLKNWLGIKSKSVLTFHDFANKLAQNMEFAQTTNEKIARPCNVKNNKISIWKKNQSVSHPKFGTGLIKKAEKKDAENYYLTIIFKSGEKKILSSFIKKI